MEIRSEPAAQQQEDLRCPDLQVFQGCFPEGSFLNHVHSQEAGLILSRVEHSRMKKRTILNSYCCFGEYKSVCSAHRRTTSGEVFTTLVELAGSKAKPFFY